MENEQIMKRLEKIENLLLCQKTVLNMRELSEYTGYSMQSLYQLTMKHKIPGMYKPIGTHLYFDRKEIDKWLLSNGEKE